jgi:TolB-like protein/Tfp pilus assembly protein PilF
MFTDIVGYTALMGSDEDKAFEILRKNRRIHNQFLQEFNGKLVKEIGDGMLMSFNLPSDAVRCAIKIQEACKAEQIPLKVGIHDGEVTFEGSDVFGDGVNISSRLQGDARKGNIYVSDSVYRNVKNKKDIRSRFIDEKKYKNVDEIIKVYQIITSDDELLEKPVKAGKTRRKYLRYAIIGLLGLATTTILIWKFYPVSDMDKERSIAVMPFSNLTGDSSNIYLANGMMEEIRNKLAKISDLRVTSKTSTEKFRGMQMSLIEIADQLQVNYLVEGSIQRQGEIIKVHAELINVQNDDQIWAENYTHDITNIFSVQNEVAQAIAGQLKAVISPREMKIIESIPTRNSEAYDLYLRGKELFHRGGESNIKRAIYLYDRAIELDPEFALAYVWKGLAYFEITVPANFYKENFADTMLYFANKALSIDPDLSEGYWLRAEYYWQRTEHDISILEAKKAIQLDPNNGQAYKILGLNLYYQKNFIEALQNLGKARKILILDPDQYPEVLDKIATVYMAVGDYEKTEEYIIEWIDYEPVNGYFGLWVLNLARGELNKSRTFLDSMCTMAGSNFCHWTLALHYAYTGQFEKLDPEKDSLHLIEYTAPHWRAFIYQNLGIKDEAEKYFNLALEQLDKTIELERLSAEGGTDFYDKAGQYAFIGEKEITYEILHFMEETRRIECWQVWGLQHDPRFKTMRDEEKFKNIVNRLENYYAEIRLEIEKFENAGMF